VKRRERVIARMREARDIHQHWADGLRAGDTWMKEPAPRKRTGGGITWHERWVRIYNDVLRELGEKP